MISQKLDELIGAPPRPNQSKRLLNSSYMSMPQLMDCSKALRKDYFKLNNSFKTLVLNDSFTNLKKIKSKESLVFKKSQAKRIYIAKCDDLKIAPVPQLEKRFYSYLDNVHKNREINLSDNRLGLKSAETIGKLLKFKRSFCKLNLSKNFIGDEGLKQLIDSLSNSHNIIHMDLSSNDIKSEGASYFFKKLHNNQNLISVDLSSQGLHKNKLGPEGVYPLRETLKTSLLVYLKLSDSSIGKEGLVHISEGLANNTTLKFLDISKNFFGGKTIKKLCDALLSSKLLELNLSSNKIMNEGAEPFYDFFLAQNNSGSVLRSLNLSDNEISFKGSNKIFGGLNDNKILQDLNLEMNPLSEFAGNGIFYCLENNNVLATLNLSSSHLKKVGIQKLFEVLMKNSSLTTLILKENYIKDEGVAIICESLQYNNALSKIDLSKNHISRSGVLRILSMLKTNNCINAIFLEDNHIKDDVSQSIIDSIKNKPNFHVLKLDGNQISMRSMQTIKQTLENNKLIHRDICTSQLKNEVCEISKISRTINSIYSEISELKREKIKQENMLVINIKSKEEIKDTLESIFSDIQKEYNSVNKEHLKVTLELRKLEKLTLETNCRIGKDTEEYKHNIKTVDSQIEELKNYCKT